MSLKINLKLLAGAALMGAVGLNLSACGKFGPLEPPAPLFGEKAKEDYAARRNARTVQTEGRTPATPAADQADPDADNAPRTTRDLKAPEQQAVPISQDPIAGIPDPNGPRPSMSPPGAR
jgi:hypothetical protein